VWVVLFFSPLGERNFLVLFLLLTALDLVEGSDKPDQEDADANVDDFHP
jgi:hypothetical protein